MKDRLSEFLTDLLKPVIEIRPGERVKTLVMFVYFLLIIATVWILKPVRNALFLEELGAKNLPYTYIGEPMFLLLFAWGFATFSKKVSQKILYVGVLGFYIGCLILFWFLFHTTIPYLSFVFYIWVASYSISMTTIFFTLANDIFNPNEAKRLFGLILSGGSIGGVLGGLTTEKLAAWLHTENLLLVVAGVIFVIVVFVMAMWNSLKAKKSLSKSEEEKHSVKVSAEKKVPFPSTRKLFTGSSYLLMLAGIVVLAKMTSTVIDNQFNGIVEISILGTDARTAFYGGFGKWVNAVSFLGQLVITSLALRYLGVGISLWMLPVGIALGSVFCFFNPVLLAGCFLKLFDGAGNYSIQQACREVLYLPVPSNVRYKVKPIIDMLGFRLAKGLGGAYILLFTFLIGLKSENLNILIWFLIPLWVFLAWRMKSGYSKLLRERLVKKGKFTQAVKAQRATDVLSFLHDEKDFHQIKSFMNHRSAYARKLAAAAYLAYARSEKEVGPAKDFIHQLIRHEAFDQIAEGDHRKGLKNTDIQFLEQLMSGIQEREGAWKGTCEQYLTAHYEEILIKLGSILRDPDEGLASKRRAVRIIEMIPRQESTDLLLHTLAAAQDHTFRFVMIKALNRLFDQNSNIHMNRFLIKSEITRETKIHDKIHKIHWFYLEKAGGRNLEEDYLGVALKAISEESMERIFRYLHLLYPNEGIRVIYDRMIENPEDDPVRIHAAELLTNTVEPDLLIILQRVLDGKKVVKVKERDVIEILKSFSRSQDRWFSVMSAFLVSDLDLDEKWPELEDLNRQNGFTWIQEKN